jgi:sterol desaturase/sphingolipid hydroxylase (fatty acid hydroxylase superfamily)
VTSLLGGNGNEPLTRLGVYAGDGTVLVAGILIIDLYIYVMHRIQHAVFVLWRFHAVHHSDDAVDASTALRHHPMEYLVNVAIGNLLLALIGVPLWVLATYGVLSMTAALFQHVNARLPSWLETMLDLVIVGPALHRAHHSSDPAHYNSNFGNVLTVWDRLFGTYHRLPATQQARIVFGVEELNASGRMRGVWLWVLPFLIRDRPQPAPRLI